MAEIILRPLAGTAPLGFLAALGALGVATRMAPGRVTLRWTEDLVPAAVLDGPADADELIDWCLRDLRERQLAGVLTFPAADIKPAPEVLHSWAKEMAEEDRCHSDLFTGLLAEGAQAGNNASKPTHLHFTAGQQQFLSMVRLVAGAVDRSALAEALQGPWLFESTLPTLGWDTRGERVYALRGTDPAKEKRTGVPGADWLAFLGLAFLPVFARDGRLLTTACEPSWKSGAFIWPLWSAPLTAPVVRSLLAFEGLRTESARQREARGVFRLLRAPISRSDQGGYGSFRAAQVMAPPAAVRRQRRGQRHG